MGDCQAFALFSASPGMTHGVAVPRFLLRRIMQGAPQLFFKRKNLPPLGGSAASYSLWVESGSRLK
jgi:hypothetical protein